MVRTPSSEKSGLRKGTWTPDEDRKLIAYVTRYGSWNWRQLPKFAGLSRCGKSCRLRWLNYLRPNIKRGNYTEEEEETIIKLHESLGNRWSAIAAHLPGRTDNEIKNHWHTYLKKRAQDSHANSEKTTSLASNDIDEYSGTPETEARTERTNVFDFNPTDPPPFLDLCPSFPQPSLGEIFPLSADSAAWSYSIFPEDDLFNCLDDFLAEPNEKFNGWTEAPLMAESLYIPSDLFADTDILMQNIMYEEYQGLFG